ncbi:ABC transporter permease subunit [Methanocella sp. MCL-LM]|uniref:ABC transporter permease subunit n=1 Tax=Methanocella sp. MCL-LM TaxID=3412035 RepID=UPI003C70CE3E
MRTIILIAKSQMLDMLREHLVLCIIGLIAIIIILNAAANAIMIPEIDIHVDDGNDHFFSVGMSNPLFETSVLLSILSMFIGLSITTEDRAYGTLRVLITKPLYRRDVLVGKFIGLSFLLLLIILSLILLCVSTQILLYRAPYSTEDLILRISSYVFVLFLSCELTLSISILLGVVFKKFLSVLLFAGAFIGLEWYFIPPESLQGIVRYVIPKQLYITILEADGQASIFETVSSFGTWLNGSLPLIVLMIAEILLVMLISTWVFTKDDE